MIEEGSLVGGILSAEVVKKVIYPTPMFFEFIFSSSSKGRVSYHRKVLYLFFTYYHQSYSAVLHFTATQHYTDGPFQEVAFNWMVDVATIKIRNERG
jgi:hypothetical protein